MNIFKTRQEWSSYSDIELKNYINKVFHYYREAGFPYISDDQSWRIKEFRKLQSIDCNSLFDNENKEYKQVMHGLSLAWSYFRHHWEIRCNNLLTPFEVFNNDKLFKKVLLKVIKHSDKMSDSSVRKRLKTFTGAQGVSNFRPTIACAIYNKFAKNGSIWDMSGGFGGRLFGFIVSNAKSYLATEPSTKSYKGLLEIKKDYTRIYSSLFDKKKIEIIKLGSEDFLPEKESLDLCFTSPPYFNCEKYSNEDTQSWKKYPFKKEWTLNFLYKTFQNCYYGLKPKKYMLINIANVKSYSNLEDKTIKYAEKAGFKYIDTEFYLLSAVNKQGFKKEPIFIFQKF